MTTRLMGRKNFGLLNNQAKQTPLEAELQLPEQGLQTLVDKDALTPGVTDIVAIHGLNGHYEKTWMEEMSQYNWLRDVFSATATGESTNVKMMVRVLSFAYNAKVQHSKSIATVFDFAHQLLECLLIERQSNMEQSRPIIFICHSLGGIVFKQVYNRACSESRYEDLARRITGVLFFGTPHKGSPVASMATVLGNMLKVSSLGTHTNAQLLRDLKQHSPVLEQISDTFLQLGGRLKIITFYETEKMDNMASPIVSKDSAIMNMKNEVAIPLDRNHRNICKFSSRSDTVLRLVLGKLSFILDDDKVKDQTNKEILLQSLATSNPDFHKARNPRPVHGTCRWILKHDSFTRWLHSPSPGLLWLSANPGCGKSVLASFLVDHLRTDKEMNICYFFFKSDNVEQRSAVHALQAVLYQILQVQRELLNEASKKLSVGTRHSLEDLWSTLVACLRLPEARNTICVLDGFDECEVTSRKELTKLLSVHFNTDKNSSRLGSDITSKLRVFVSSRPENSLKIAFDRQRSGSYDQKCTTIRLRGEDETDEISNDIGLVINAEISEIIEMGLPKEMLEDVHLQLVARADRTFLWVTMIIQLIKERVEGGASRREIEAILHSHDIYAVYSELLSSLQQGSKARKMLSLVLAATRPLSVEELSIALAVKPEHDTFDATEVCRRPGPYSFQDLEDDLVYPFENHIKALCGHFIRVIRNKVYLVHETAREFLLEKDVGYIKGKPESWFSMDLSTLHQDGVDDDSQEVDDGSDTLVLDDTKSGEDEKSPETHWRGSFKLQNCEALCLEICVTYIYCIGKSHGVPSRRTATFLDYAATAWTTHFAEIRDRLDPRHFPYYQNLCHPRFPGFESWISAYSASGGQTAVTNPGGADDDIQDHYITLFGLDSDGVSRRKAVAELTGDGGVQYLSSNPGASANHYFPVTTNSYGWVSLNLGLQEPSVFNSPLSNPWED